ncbi:unnamed protein product [Schistosoma margrebowiei]|uniref:Egg protein CP391S-like protein n=1 Tax=Schistosoma margrebowiei TaxID=48269 RepID=A0AA84ZTM8_9TREM|nr:unnamed protein product [Schistosoma margrebowiei]
MMRYTFSSGQFILICLVIVIISKCFDCHEICENPGLANYSKLIFEDDSHEYSHNYYYFQTIRRNQLSPVVNDIFVKLAKGEEITLKFPFKYYGTDFSALKMGDYGNTGLIQMNAEQIVGIIYIFLENGTMSEYEISNENDLLAVRMILHRQVDGKNVTLQVLNLIHPSGKISLYYENVSEEIEENDLESEIYIEIPCGVGVEKTQNVPDITVRRKWIKTGTLVEYEISGDCPNHNSSKACEDAKTSNTTCIWCEHANMCITSNDKNTHNFKVNGCRNKNVTTETNENEEERKSRNYSWMNKQTNVNDYIQLLVNELSLFHVNVNKEDTSPTGRKPVDEAIIKAIQTSRKLNFMVSSRIPDANR